jgi:hypothetical protein
MLQRARRSPAVVPGGPSAPSGEARSVARVSRSNEARAARVAERAPEPEQAPTTFPEGPELAEQKTPGPLRPSRFRSGQKGALIGTSTTVRLTKSPTGEAVAAEVADGAPAEIVQTKDGRLKVKVRSGEENVEGWVDAGVFSDQPALTKDESNKKLRDEYVYSHQAGDHSPKAPTGKDTAQGAAGDCFFIASMAAVANAAPNVIADMVTFDAGRGVYSVRFHEEQGRGAFKPVFIEVDGWLPTAEGSRNDPAYAGDPGQALWPAIIEKAYAKWKGGYDVINEGGTGDVAMSEITGVRSQNKSPSSMKEDEVVPYFAQAQKDGKAIYAGVRNDRKAATQAPLKGSGDGAYSGTLQQTHRWNEIVPGTVRVTDKGGKAPSARDEGVEGDERGSLDGRGVKAGEIGYKDSSVTLTYDTGKGPEKAEDLAVDFHYHGVLDTDAFLIGNHAYAFEGVVEGDKLQFYNPWGTYQPKPITAATFLEHFDSLSVNQPPASKAKS